MIGVGMVCVLGLAGCAPDVLARSALKHDQRADRRAELGDGYGAAYERWIAESRLQQSDFRAMRRGTWMWSDLTLE